MLNLLSKEVFIMQLSFIHLRLFYYGFHSLTPLDLSPLPLSEQDDCDGKKEIEFVR